MEDSEIRKAVRERYGAIAEQVKSGSASSCCNTGKLSDSTDSVSTQTEESCCGPQESFSKTIGYSEKELKIVPEDSNLGLGCGNPTALASLKEGETVVDLGSGGGIDCFLATEAVGKSGRVIGVDMTPQMIELARQNAEKDGYKNVEFRLGEIENLPVADNSADVIISNCVINLSPDKNRVFKEACRILKPGGRIMISDMVLLKVLPESIMKSIEAYTGCISGALTKEKYLETLHNAGFDEVDIVSETTFGIDGIESAAASINFRAVKSG